MSQENEYIEEELLEEEVETDEVEIEEEDNDSDEIDWKERAIAEKERRIKAELSIVKAKKQKAPVQKAKVSNNDSQVDLLRFNGVPMNEIEQIKKIAALEGTDLIDARNSEYFSIWKAKQEAEQISKQASVGTSSRGKSAVVTVDKARERIMAGIATKEDYALVRKK